MKRKKIVFLMIAVILVLSALPGIRIIANEFRKETAYQLMVNDEKWVIVSKRESLEELLDEYQQQFLFNVDKEAEIKKISFLQKVEIVEVAVMPDEISTLAEAKEKIFAVEEPMVQIEIQKGDNFWNISKANSISVNQIEILNPDLDPDKIFPGDKLVLKPMDPVLDVIIELENTIVESIPFNNVYRKDSNLYKNQRRTIKRGVEGKKEVSYNINLLNGYQSFLEVESEKVLKEPVNAIVRIGTKTSVSRGGRINYGVVSGKRISSLYGYRIHPITGRKRYHDGLDIAATHGNAVYAYSSGKVVQAGWNGGYGYQVLIDHGNGLKTRYAHLSKIYVRIGQKVGTGERIGAVGSTGNSTGPHLHFEVIKNGRTQNPLNYI